jgi:protein involved in polysaccharide export with SLBB domain
MPTLARHRRPGRGMLLSILIAAAVFWTGISVGIWFGRRHGPAPQPPPKSPTAAAPAAAAPTGAVATTQGSGSTAAAATNPADVLQPGDRVELRVADLSGPGKEGGQVTTVDASGQVTLPVLGKFRAQYLTPAQLEQAIARGYKERNLMPPGAIRVVRLPATAPTVR